MSVAIAAAALIAGCASKVPPHAASYAPGPSGDAAIDPVAALQADLAAKAGDRVLFDLDSFGLTVAARSVLVRQAEWLRAHPGVAFSIEGHCDERGTRDYNLALGERRAKAAASFLMGQGVSPGRISTISYGKERPEALGSDEGSYAQNRRAVSIVLRP